MIETLKIAKTSDQVLVITVPNAKTYKAKANFYEKQKGEWRHIYQNLYAVAGKNGIVINRKQNTGTTPMGNYGFVYGFGIQKNPGIQYEYRQIGKNDYWVTDPESSLYNRWANEYTGWNRKEEEHLISYGYVYDYAMVMDFNYYHPIKGDGAGIFLHVASNSGEGTAGCIGMKKQDLLNIMLKLNPEMNPRIIIAVEKDIYNF